MARLWTGDFEEGDITDYTFTDIATGAIVASTSFAKEGTYSAKHTTAAGGGSKAAYGMHFVDADNLHTTDREFFFAAYIYPVTLSNGVKFMGFGAWNSTVAGYCSVRRVAGGALVLRNEIAAADVGTSTATLLDDQWTLIEIRMKPNNTTGELELRMAAVSEVSGTSLDTKDGANGDARVGAGIVSPGANNQEVYCDLLRLNDDQGASDNTWPGEIGGATIIDAAIVSILLPEQAATLKADISLTASMATIGLTDFSPTLATDISFTAGIDSITLTTQAASVKLGVVIDALTKALSLTVPSATVLTDISFTASSAALVVTTQQATVVLGIQVNPSSVAVSISPQSASLNIQMAVAAALQSISLSGLSASLNIAKLIASQAASIGLTPRNATVQEGGMAGGVAWMMGWDEEGRGSWWAG